jgi:site-specific DNA recombinase
MREGFRSRDEETFRRCAVYTRKSHEDGLEQDFNSLDAQREACEAFIRSQAARGWELASGHYDDGGFSGGTMERPALKRLLKDVDAGAVDTIVVYKIDRLSRSLLDFFRMVELFEERGVSFVSVTEQFNTTDSSGRLMLGILMSFAQYEREIAGERIRDKVAAAKRHGKWCGGPPTLGYDVDRPNKRLVVNEEEARIVRRIFRRFNQTGSSLQVVRELNADGLTTKAWVTKKGKRREGHAWDVPAVGRLIRNRLYTGELEHNGNVYPGEHEAIIGKELWERTGELLSENHRTRRMTGRLTTDSPLRGLIRCGHCGCAMSPTYTKRHGRQFHYYLCKTSHRRGAGACPVSRVASGEIEKVVVEQLGAVFRTPALVAKTFMAARTQEDEERERLNAKREHLKSELSGVQNEAVELIRAGGDPARIMELNENASSIGTQLDQIERELDGLGGERITEHDVADAFGTLEELWEVLFPVEKHRLIHMLVERVTVWLDGLDLKLKAVGVTGLVADLTGYAEETRQRGEET